MARLGVLASRREGPAASEDVAGAIRSTLAPVKPRRTSSMRDQPATPTSSPSASCNGRTAGQNGMTTMHQARQLPGVEVRQRMMPASDSSVSVEWGLNMKGFWVRFEISRSCKDY